MCVYFYVFKLHIHIHIHWNIHWNIHIHGLKVLKELILNLWKVMKKYFCSIHLKCLFIFNVIFFKESVYYMILMYIIVVPRSGHWCSAVEFHHFGWGSDKDCANSRPRRSDDTGQGKERIDHPYHQNKRLHSHDDDQWPWHECSRHVVQPEPDAGGRWGRWRRGREAQSGRADQEAGGALREGHPAAEQHLAGYHGNTERETRQQGSGQVQVQVCRVCEGHLETLLALTHVRAVDSDSDVLRLLLHQVPAPIVVAGPETVGVLGTSETHHRQHHWRCS